MPTDGRTASNRNDPERINRARQIAEDLFKPTPKIAHADLAASAPNDASPAERQPRRQPRIFPPVVPMNKAKVAPAAEPEQTQRIVEIKREDRGIPASQFGRVRTLARYGMTKAQVGDLYEVTIDEIDRIIRSRS